MIEAVPFPHYGKWRHMPPRDLERTPCRHLGGAGGCWGRVYHSQYESARLLPVNFLISSSDTSAA